MQTKLAFDRSSLGSVLKERLAFDRATVRRIDHDGRLHVEFANISKANVCGYAGSEIPDPTGQLNLDPSRTYMLLRSPEELAKGAPTFNGIPIIDFHTPTNAYDPKIELTIGCTGTDAEFVDPYLRNSLSFWTAEAIEGIENDEKRELSCGYYYRADMTPGVYEGIQYDGIMRDIKGNHVVTCEVGRAGPDVVVGDSALPIHIPETEESPMAKTNKPSMAAVLTRGALLANVVPKLAADQKIDHAKLTAGLTPKNYAAKLPGILGSIKPKLANDADFAAIQLAFDAMSEEVKKMEAEDEDPDMQTAMDEDDEEEKAKKDKEAKEKAAMDAEADEAEKTKADKDKKDEKTAMDSAIKVAMDAAIKQAKEETLKQARETREAESFVRGYVGDLAIACDSAEQVYKAALDILKVDVTGVPTVAYKHILAAQPKPGERKHVIAQDSVMLAADKSEFKTRFPNSRAAH